MLHPDDVISGIDVVNLAGDATRQIAEEIHGGIADFFDRHAAAQRRIVLVPFQDVTEVADPRRCQRLDRSRRNGVDANVLVTQVGGEIAHGRLERSLGDSHHVVMGHPLLGAVVGKGQQRAAPRHQLLRAPGKSRERVATHQHGFGKIIRRRVHVPARQLIPVGKGDGMHEKIERPPFRFQRCESRVDRAGLSHVAMADYQSADLLRERLHALLECVALVSEGKLGALSTASLCDAPGKRPVVSNTQDQAPFAAQEARRFRHDLPRWPNDSDPPYDIRQQPPQAVALRCHLAPRRGNIAPAKVFAGVISSARMRRPNRRCLAARGRERALGGFRQAIEAAVPALRRYARALTRNGELADDLVQDTLVRALRSEHLFHGGDIRSWLYTILTNLNRNRLRALARRPALQSIDDNDAPEVAGPEAGARDIERALASLVEDQRSALLLVVLEGLTYREVAEVQGVPIGTVMSRLARARMQIKAYLDGERPALRRVK